MLVQNLNYYDLGDASLVVEVGQFGTIRGEFDDHYAVRLGFTLCWIFKH